MAFTPVQKELGKIAADYRRYKVLVGLAICWGVASLCGLLLLILFKFFGIVLPFSVQALVGFSLLAACIVGWRNARIEIALRHIARQIEQDDPKLNSLLLAALEQQPDPKTGTLNFLQRRVIEEAIEANRKSPWNQKFVERVFWAQSVHLVLLCLASLIFLATAIIVPVPKTLVGIGGSGVEIQPGNTSVEKGRSVAISAKFNGKPPGEVMLAYETPSTGEKRMPMARSLNDPLFGITLPEVQEKTTYRIEYAGAQSAPFAVDVFEYPELKRADAELKYPGYTGFAPARIEDTKRISAVEGTKVHYTFFLNKSVKTARLLGTNNIEVALTNDAKTTIAYTSDFALTNSGNYKLELVDDAGRTNKLPENFVFIALENQRPKLKLQAPRGDQRVSALEEVKFEGQAEDDFGLTGYGLAYTMAGKKNRVC